MRRRRTSAGVNGSLELFLDTICNMFGGIMFMAILLSVLLQMRGKEAEVEASSTKTISRSEAEAYSAEVELLERQRKQLLATVELLEQKNSSDEQSEAIQKQQELMEARRRLDSVISQQAEMSKLLSNLKV